MCVTILAYILIDLNCILWEGDLEFDTLLCSPKLFVGGDGGVIQWDHWRGLDRDTLQSVTEQNGCC